VNTAVISQSINSRHTKTSARTAEMFAPDGILATYTGLGIDISPEFLRDHQVKMEG
jgi:hypothetical protein